MLGHVSSGAAVFAPQRQALEQAQGDQDDRRRHADGRIAGQQTHHCGGNTHDDDGDEEGVLTPDHVAQAAEHDSAEGPHGKACGEGQQGEDERGGFIDPGEEMLGDDRRQ